MAGKHKTKRDARRVATARMKVFNQVATIGLLLIAAAVITWIIISAIQSNLADKGSTPEPASGLPTLIGTKQYSGPPPMLIDVSKKYLATVKMAKGGEFVIQLFPDKAPITVNSFVFLAREGFFDGVTFHRVLEGFGDGELVVLLMSEPEPSPDIRVDALDQLPVPVFRENDDFVVSELIAIVVCHSDFSLLRRLNRMV